MLLDDAFQPLPFYRRTAIALMTLAVLGIVSTPAAAQVVIGGDSTAQDAFSAPSTTRQVPDWLLRYATPETKAKSQQKPAATPKLKRARAKENVKGATARSDAELTAIKRKNLINPEQPAGNSSRIGVQGIDQAVTSSPWSPRAQVTQSKDLFPEITKHAEEALMVPPRLAGAKPSQTRGESSLPPVLTPDLMDNMVLAARDSATEAKPSEPVTDYALAGGKTASGIQSGTQVRLTGGEEFLDEGAYSPKRAGTEGQFVLGQIGEAQQPVSKPVTKSQRKLFSSDDAKPADKTGAKLLADINQEPRPEPARNDDQPALPANPPQIPVPSTVARREDEIRLPGTDQADDSLRPLDDVVAAVPPANPPKRRLLAALSDDRADVSATKPAPSAEHILVPPKEAVAAITPAVTPRPAPDVAEVKVSVDTPAATVTASDAADIDITQMGSAPRLLGRMSDGVASAAPTPKAAPAPKVEVAAVEPQKIEPVNVAPKQPDLFDTVTPAPVEVPDTIPVAKEQRTLLTIDAPDTAPPAEVAVAVDETPPSVAPVVEKPKTEPKRKPTAKQAPVSAPEIKVEVPDVAAAEPAPESAPAPAAEPEWAPAPPPPIANVDKSKRKTPATAHVTVREEPEVRVDLANELAVTIPPKPEAQVLQAPVAVAPSREPVPLVAIERAERRMPTINAPAPTAVAEETMPVPVPDMPRQQITVAPSSPAAVAPMAAPTLAPRQQIIAPPPNLRVETPAAPMGTPTRLRTPKLLVDSGMSASAPSAVGAAAPLVTLTPGTGPAMPTIGTGTNDAVITPSLDTTPATNVAETIYFAPDARELDETSKRQIDALAERLEDNPDQRVMLTAYADANLLVEARRMALARALAIRSRLAEQGIQPVRIDVRALGAKGANDNAPADRVDVSVR